MARVKREPRWYFSLRSPYSWLAYHDLRNRFADVLDTVRWIPCWDIDERTRELMTEAGASTHYTPMSRAKNFYILTDVRRLAAARGLPMRWPVDNDPVWENAHLGYLVAQRHERGREFVHAAYRARWEQGRNICDADVLTDLAREIDLDPTELLNAPQDPEIRRLGTECMVESYRDGVFGVPHFVHGREGYWGVERLAAFASAVRGEPVQDSPELLWTADVDSGEPWRLATVEAGHAGGCG